MKKAIVLLFLSILAFSKVGSASSPTPIQFVVYGDLDKYYPVVFTDVNWYKGRTSVAIYRPNVHTDSSWRGSLVAEITFHTTRWGHKSNFTRSDIRQLNSFVGDFKDMTSANSSTQFVIWLKGGGTTYFYHGINCDPSSPVIYDDNQNALPFQETNGGTYSWISSPNTELNQNGITDTGQIYILGTGTNYFKGKVGINCSDTEGNQLAVNGPVQITGSLKASEIKVEAQTADFVFDKNYDLKKLDDVELFIEKNKHLPDIPSAAQMEASGVDLAEMNKLLLQKIEELTLYVIEQNKKIEENDNRLAEFEILQRRLIILESTLLKP